MTDYTLVPITLRDHLDAETEGDRSPSGRFVIPELEETIDIELLAVQRMLDSRWLARVQTITAREFGQLSAVEQRTWRDRCERIQKRFSEQLNMMNRNLRGAEPAVPTFLQARVSA